MWGLPLNHLLQHVMKRAYPAGPPMHMTKPARSLFLLAAVSALAAIACGIAIKRDLSTIPQGQIGFDDMCGLQDYFDALEARGGTAPTVVSSLDLEGGDGHKAIRGGKARLAFQTDFQLKHLRRILNDNWQRLPEELATASKVEIEVRWAEKAGVKRVLTDQDSELFIGNESFALPYQVCLSEFLYGEPLYRQRRIIWGLPIPVPPSDGGAKKPAEVVAPPVPEAGTVDAHHDAGVPTNVIADTARMPDAGVAADAARDGATQVQAPGKKRGKRGK
jgi:hypothetical protein